MNVNAVPCTVPVKRHRVSAVEICRGGAGTHTRVSVCPVHVLSAVEIWDIYR